MIPSIEEIIAGLLSGAYTREQASAWLETHMLKNLEGLAAIESAISRVRAKMEAAA